MHLPKRPVFFPDIHSQNTELYGVTALFGISFNQRDKSNKKASNLYPLTTNNLFYLKTFYFSSYASFIWYIFNLKNQKIFPNAIKYELLMLTCVILCCCLMFLSKASQTMM